MESGAKEKELRRLRDNLGEKSTDPLLCQRTTRVTTLAQQARSLRKQKLEGRTSCQNCRDRKPSKVVC